MSEQQRYYKKVLNPKIITSDEYARFLKKVEHGELTREENAQIHTCGMIIPFDPRTKKILVVHHKKANSWLFPGGHIDKGELPITTIVREAKEELGLQKTAEDFLGPFGAQILDIENPSIVCRSHYDLFYAIPVRPAELMIDMREFHAYKWLSIEEAREKITLKYYQQSLDKFLKFMDW